VAALKAQPGAGEIKVAPRPPEIPASTLPQIKSRKGGAFSVARLPANGMFTRMAADRYREEIYIGDPMCASQEGLFRLDGKTGEFDRSWFPNGEFQAGITECHVGPDGLLYLRVGAFGYGQWILRVDHDGKPVDFGGDAVALPADGTWTAGEKKYGKLAGQKVYGGLKIAPFLGGAKVLWTGEDGHSNVHARGLYISPKGMIVAGLLLQGPATEYEAAHGIPANPGQHSSFVAVWDLSGNLRCLNALGNTGNGHGVAMDRDGNIYAAIARARNDKPDGIADVSAKGDEWGGMGSLAKFRWNGKWPLANLQWSTGKHGSTEGSLWTYFGLTAQPNNHCSCYNVRYDTDYFARSFLIANHLLSVMVLDANGNRVARLGRYGNVDDTEADVKAGKDGLRFAWLRAVAVSDTALYAVDRPNRRILKAALSYAAEETVPLP
jgi:hypothetical protein